MELSKNEYVMYKGLPLVREGNTICYGDVNEKYILMLDILKKNENGDPDLIMVSICHTEDRNKLVPGKQTMKNSLIEALDLGSIWLEHLNKEENK